MFLPISRYGSLVVDASPLYTLFEIYPASIGSTGFGTLTPYTTLAANANAAHSWSSYLVVSQGAAPGRSLAATLRRRLLSSPASWLRFLPSVTSTLPPVPWRTAAKQTLVRWQPSLSRCELHHVHSCIRRRHWNLNVYSFVQGMPTKKIRSTVHYSYMYL